MSQQGIASDVTTPLADIETITGNSGGAVGPDGAGNIDLVGAQATTVSGDAGTNTLTITVGPDGLSISEVTGTSQAAEINTCYIANNVALVTITLPTSAAVGDVVEIVGKGAGLWRIAQNAGQTINFNSSATTTGAAGSITATQRYSCLKVRCITATTDWVVSSSEGAAFTIV